MDIQDRINAEAQARLAVIEMSERPIHELMIDANVLALMLFQAKDMPCTEWKPKTETEPGESRCLEREGKRLVGWPKLPADAVYRAWENFDPKKLCNNCRPYYFAQMAANEMRWSSQREADRIEDEKQKPEVSNRRCDECGVKGVMDCLGVNVNGADKPAWVCRNCGHPHFLET